MEGKRPSQSLGGVAKVLSETVFVKFDLQAQANVDINLDELFEVTQVRNSRNFRIRPIIASGSSTPWTILSPYDQHRAVVVLVDAFEKAGYGFPEVGQPVRTAFRSVGQQNRNYAPQLFINEKPFDREGAQATAQFRNVLQNGTDEQRKAAMDALEKIGASPESAKAVGDAIEGVAEEDAPL